MQSDPLVVAGIAAALIVSTYMLMGLPMSESVLIGVPAGVALVYRFDRTSDASAEDSISHRTRRQWLQRHRGYVWGTTVLYVALGGWAFIHLSLAAQSATLAFVALGALYVWPLGGWRIKDIGAPKTLVVALVWSAGVVGFPVLNHGLSSPAIDGGYASVLGLFAYRMGWLFPNLLCSDWADREADRAAELTTLAHGWSHGQVRGVAAGCAGIAALAAGAVAWSTGSAVWGAEAAASALLAVGVGMCPRHPGPTYRLALDLYMAVPGLIAVWAVWVTG